MTCSICALTVHEGYADASASAVQSRKSGGGCFCLFCSGCMFCGCDEGIVISRPQDVAVLSSDFFGALHRYLNQAVLKSLLQ